MTEPGIANATIKNKSVQKENDFSSLMHHLHTVTGLALDSPSKSLSAPASETPRNNENGSSVQFHGTTKGSLWEPSLCQGLIHPFTGLCLTCFRIQKPSVTAIHGKLPPRMTSTEAQACPATSIPACCRASHLDHYHQ